MAGTAQGGPVLELRDVAKSFGPVVALRSGTLAVDAGSIHALVGENGAGKSTLVKIVAGVHRRDSGELLLEGESVDFSSTAESKARGIAVIYQEPTLFPDLSVTENIFMGRQPLASGRRIDRAAMHAEATELFDRLGVHIDPRRPARGLSIADQQIIEIAKAISLDAKLLVMDEPTAALSGVEVDRLFAVARSLRDEGRALVFISHRFDEVFALCDPITVMRDGDYIGTRTPPTPPSTRSSRRWSAARSATSSPRPRPRSATGPRGRRPRHDRHLPRRLLRGARRRDRRPGRPGRRRPQRDRPRRLRRRRATTSGSVSLGGTPVRGANPRAAIRAGMAFVPEDRRKQGLVTEGSVARNVASVIRSAADARRRAHRPRREPGRRPLGRAARGQDQRPRHARRDDERRQPAEGRHRQVAGHRARAADHRRAHPRHRRRHQGRGAPAPLRPRRPGHGDPDDLLRAARGARHGRPRARRLRGPHHRRASRAPRPPRRTSCVPPPAWRRRPDE